MNIYDPTDGAASMLQTIERLKGNDLTTEQARKQIATNVKTGNASVKPNAAAVQELTDYISKHYPKGNVPANLREAVTLAQQGGINDMGIAARVQADIGDRTRGTGSGAEPNPINAAAKLVNSPNPRLAQYYGYDMPGLLGDTLSAPVDLAKAQDAERLGPTGLGALGPLFSAAGIYFGLPALTGLAGAAQTPNSPLSIGSVVAMAAQDGAFDNVLSSMQGGFKNPEALGLDPGSLYSPQALSAPASTTVRGFEGLSSSHLYRPEALTGTWGAFDFAPRPGLEGLKPEQLYRPEALGPQRAKPARRSYGAPDVRGVLPPSNGTGSPAMGPAPVTNIYQPDAVPYTYGSPETIYPGFFGGEPDAQDLFGGNKPGTKHGTRAGAVDSVLRNAQPWNIYQ